MKRISRLCDLASSHRASATPWPKIWDRIKTSRLRRSNGDCADARRHTDKANSGLDVESPAIYMQGSEDSLRCLCRAALPPSDASVHGSVSSVMPRVGFEELEAALGVVYDTTYLFSKG